MSDREPPQIRSATEAETARTLATITAAFITDPMARFALPDPQTYLEAMPLVAAGMGGASFAGGSAYVAPGFKGAALWIPPGVHGEGGSAGGALGDLIPADRVEDLGATLAAMAAHHPEEPHWYLPLIGVEPFAQGEGLGAALMKHALRRIDDEGAVAYLESSNPRNLSLYLRFGFEVIGEIKIGSAPLVTPMLRRPR